MRQAAAISLCPGKSEMFVLVTGIIIIPSFLEMEHLGFEFCS